MRRILWTMIAIVGLAAAQDKPPEKTEKMVSRVIPVRYVNVNHLRDLLNIPGVRVVADNEMHVLVISGSPEAVASLEELAKKLDFAPPSPPPAPNVEVTVFLVFGSAEVKADEIPAELTSTVKQLHTAFGYKSYRMADSFAVRGRDGEGAHANGVVGNTHGTYRFSYARASVSTESPRIIRIDRLDMGLKVENITKNSNPLVQVNPMDSGLNTSIDVREGQKVVVGKSNVNGTDEAMILVITARVVE
jgi:hypothetical protein